MTFRSTFPSDFALFTQKATLFCDQKVHFVEKTELWRSLTTLEDINWFICCWWGHLEPLESLWNLWSLFGEVGLCVNCTTSGRSGNSFPYMIIVTQFVLVCLMDCLQKVQDSWGDFSDCKIWSCHSCSYQSTLAYCGSHPLV